MRKKHLILLLFLLCTVNLFAQNKQKDLEQYFALLKENDQFNGNVLVADNGRIIFEKSIGYADFSGKVLNTKTTLFPIASISKTITATAILQLVQSGKLALTDPVTKYFPGFPYPSITIRHLLSHTSGLPSYNTFFDSLKMQQPGKVFTNADFMARLSTTTKPLKYQPGDNGNYDNINFIVLALILEQVTGITYEQYISDHVLKPSGMNHTIFFPLVDQYAKKANKQFAFPYVYPHSYSDSLVKALEVPYIAGYWSSYNFTGFGDYVSTVNDLLQYDESYNKGNLLMEKTCSTMYTPVAVNNGKNNPANFGLGWQIYPDTTYGQVVYHGGNATGLSCILLRNISKHQTIIVFDNIHNDNSRAIAFNALKIINGVPIPPPKKSITKIYARLLLGKGPEIAKDSLYALSKDSLHYYLSEDELNLLGYDFMGGSNNPNPYHFPENPIYPAAVATFKLNTALFPGSWNVYDSYGEALLKTGQKDAAIKMYRRSIELNPKNEEGKKILDQLLK